jgi:hypothetical protein
VHISKPVNPPKLNKIEHQTMETYVAFSTYSRANDKLKKTNMEKIKGC